jgi:hypothetical protein
LTGGTLLSGGITVVASHGDRVLEGVYFEFWAMWDDLSSDSMLIEASVAQVSAACFNCISLFAQYPVVYHLDSLLYLA